MCGICGQFRFDSQLVEQARLERACSIMRHRGPDHAGVWLDKSESYSCGLGAVRLAIQDPTPPGNQPMHDPTGRYHLVFNGEIYNFKDLRRELVSAGVSLVTGCDTEVVLGACILWGSDALRRFNGMWALAFFDSVSGVGFLSRDPFGIKPLLYSSDDRSKSLMFASELPVLSALGDWDRSTNQQALLQHLVLGHIAHPDTIYNGANRLPPGYCLSFDSSGVTSVEPFHRQSAGESRADWAGKSADFGEACLRVRGLLAEAIVGQSVSDVPIGAFLSGGLDSSIIVAELARATGKPISTFCVGWAGQSQYDESKYARIVADQYSTEHHELRLTHRDVIDAVPRMLDHLGEPVGDSSIIPTSLVAEFASRHVVVSLSGDGGDELFGGYWRYLGHWASDAYSQLPLPIRRLVIEPLLRLLGNSKSSGIGNRLRQLRKLLRFEGDDPIERHLAWSRIMAPEAEGVLRDSGMAAQACLRAREILSSIDDEDALNRILRFDLGYQLPSDMLQKVDLASMKHSLEVRVPFLDPSLVEFVSALPSSYKVDRGRRKHILVQAYRGILPEEILTRAKMGFEVPLGEYFRNELRDLFHDIVTREAVEGLELLTYEGVSEVYRAHEQRRIECADLLFALLSACWWKKTAGV